MLVSDLRGEQGFRVSILLAVYGLILSGKTQRQVVRWKRGREVRNVIEEVASGLQELIECGWLELGEEPVRL